MKKKVISLVLIGAMVASMAACGGKGEDKGDDTKSGAVTAKVIDIALTEEQYAFGVDKDQPELLTAANDFIKEIKENGQFDYNDEIPFPMIEDPITIVWQKPFVLEDRVFSTAKLFTLESEPKEIAVEDLNSSVRFTIPGKTLKDYLLITLQ